MLTPLLCIKGAFEWVENERGGVGGEKKSEFKCGSVRDKKSHFPVAAREVGARDWVSEKWAARPCLRRQSRQCTAITTYWIRRVHVAGCWWWRMFLGLFNPLARTDLSFNPARGSSLSQRRIQTFTGLFISIQGCRLFCLLFCCEASWNNNDDNNN